MKRYIVGDLEDTVVQFVKNGSDAITSNIGVSLVDVHYQDCCEHVYADWSSLDDTDFFDREFDEVEIEFIENVGFRINGYLVNCYNSQNGYYSSMLDLEIGHPSGDTVTLDISEFVEDDIN